MSILNSVIKIFVGDKGKRDLKEIHPILNKIKQHEKSIASLHLDDLRAKTLEFKSIIKAAQKEILEKIATLQEKAKTTQNIQDRDAIYSQIDNLEEDAYKDRKDILNTILPEAFAVIKDTARRFASGDELKVVSSEFDRKLSGVKSYVHLDGDKAIWSNSWDAAGKQITWDMVHYDVQLVGGVVLHQGKVAEMHTGEGKTLVATLPLYLNALTEHGTHLVTVNDYLAKRDSAWMAPIFEFHGLSVDCIDFHEPNSQARRDAYNADITYGTNNEFGFDYLRDNMSHVVGDLVQRKQNYAIVDEVDSVLIDDARTPLIISGPVPEGDRHEFDQLKPVVANIVTQQRQYVTNFLSEARKLISEGNTKDGGKLLLRTHRGLPKNKALIKFLSEEGTRQLLQKTESYYMRDNNKEMPKVDADLFFTIEEKTNHVELTEKGIDFLSKDRSDDNDFFVLPDIGTEVAKIEAKNMPPEEEGKQKDELFKDFNIKSERIHTISQLLKAYTVFEKDVEYVVMDNKIKIVDEQTGRIMEGRRYSDGLHQAIEAKESVKIEAATQTFATITLQNYFRMYRKLSGMTGTAITEAGELWEIYKLDVIEIPTNRPADRKDHDDLIYKTKREKYNAIIDDISKLSEAGRPILIGTTSVEVSELLSRMLTLRKIKHNVLNAKLHKKEADIVAEAGHSGVVTIATNMAGRGTDIKIDNEVKKAGGLAIIGTERHDSRRVDRQLRGRSGRQGDPGSSQFYVCLEDNLMRLFGSDRISKVMDRMGHKEGDVIQHGMMTRSIERAQKKVEENNFGIRKRLLEYDDVMNAQREVIYKRRHHALEGNRLKVDISNMIYDTAEIIVEKNNQTLDYKNFEYELIKHFSIVSITQKEFKERPQNEVISKIYNTTLSHYQEKNTRNAEIALPIIKSVFEASDNKFERIVVPFNDGSRTLNVVTNLSKAYETNGESLLFDFEKNVSLAIIDEHWKDHLRRMDELKQSVQLAVHEQKDPLLIYKFEAFELFKKMIEKVNAEIITFLFKAKLPDKDEQNIQEARNRTPHEKLNLSKEEVLNTDEKAMRHRQIGRGASQPQKVETIVRDQKKIGRNDKVTIVNAISKEQKEMKYKQAIPFLQSGEWVLEK